MDYPEAIALQWWTQQEPYNDVVMAVQEITAADTTRRADYMRYVRMYGNRDLYGFAPYTHNQVMSQDRVTMNVVKACCDTAVSRLSRSQPRPRFLTHGGNWSLKRKARLMERFVDHAFYAAHMYDLAPRVLLDAAVLGTGVLKVYRHGQDITLERVFPGEVFVNPADGFYGEPRNLYQRKFIDRAVLCDMFPDKAGMIREANRTTNTQDYGVDSLVDQLEVVEAWHLPSSKDSGDGRHVICITNGTLLDEQWTRGYFPFCFVRWTERLLGYWGQGVTEDILGIQLEINRLLLKIQKAFHLISTPRIYVEAGSKVRKSFFNNEMGTIIPYTGQAPIVATPPSLNREIFEHLERLYQRAFEITGVSQLSSTGQKPSGLDSGVALREYQDIEALRFTTISRQYEAMFTTAAKQIVNLGQDIYAEDNAYSVTLERDKNTIEVLDFSDINMEADDYVLKVFPASSLPHTPSGRLAMVQELLNGGLIPPEEAKQLLDFPDLESKMSLDRATSELIDRNIEFILDDGRYMPPHPYQDHALALRKVQAAIQTAEQNNVPSDRLQMLRQYLTQTHLYLEQANQQRLANQQGAMIPGAPPAAGPTGANPLAMTPEGGNMPV